MAGLLLLIILGLFMKPVTYVTRTIVIESPTTVVWRHLLEYNSYQDWQKGVKKVVLNKGDELWEGATLRFYHMDQEREISHEERVVLIVRYPSGAMDLMKIPCYRTSRPHTLSSAF